MNGGKGQGDSDPDGFVLGHKPADKQGEDQKKP
jgi:hypothetical protein